MADSNAGLRTIRVADTAAMMALVGPADVNLRAIEQAAPLADVHVRGDVITIRGPAEAAAEASALVEELLATVGRGGQIGPDDVRRVAGMLRDLAGRDSGESPSQVLTQSILSARGRTVRPKTLGQKRYVDMIDAATVVFAIGPAGTGKTYLAMAKAVQALQSRQAKRIVLTRPAVEAGERLGFLPGTLGEKIDPYLRPLHDALQDMMDPDHIPRLMDAGTIEVAPLAYMRGRTLNDAFIILDEAQNTTAEQMKMFLTRLGFGSKMVVTGDVTQTDLPWGTRSGLRVVREILDGLDGLAFCELTSRDVVRHRIVSQIIDAWGAWDAARLRERGDPRRDPGHRRAEPGHARGDRPRARDDPARGRGEPVRARGEPGHTRGDPGHTDGQTGQGGLG
ncbi:MAG: PhoH family protein [Bifidobacteriaceae bacterium]|jgi:phosphate starvation-inducible PhoH-like protein|nr:PhoH family protein [Bifidobacteriaceae bacterium]